MIQFDLIKSNHYALSKVNFKQVAQLNKIAGKLGNILIFYQPHEWRTKKSGDKSSLSKSLWLGRAQNKDSSMQKSTRIV